jgi:hypothetical protein
MTNLQFLFLFFFFFDFSLFFTSERSQRLSLESLTVFNWPSSWRTVAFSSALKWTFSFSESFLSFFLSHADSSGNHRTHSPATTHMEFVHWAAFSTPSSQRLFFKSVKMLL